jgi:hypothetical protein
MPKPIKLIRKRGEPSVDGLDECRKYFASAGRHYPKGPAYCWLPFMNQEFQREMLRDDWLSVRLLVRRHVSARAFKLLSREFDTGPSRNLSEWPREQLDALRSLTSE